MVILGKSNYHLGSYTESMEKTLKDQDLQLLTSLRRNAREKLTDISRRTQIPVSTLHDKLKGLLGGMVRKHTTLLNYERLGYGCHAHLLLCAPKEQKQALREFLEKHPNVNSAFKINNGWTYLVDGVFLTLDALDQFLDVLESRFDVTQHQVHYIIDEIKRESFLTDDILHGQSS